MAGCVDVSAAISCSAKLDNMIFLKIKFQIMKNLIAIPVYFIFPVSVSLTECMCVMCVVLYCICVIKPTFTFNDEKFLCYSTNTYCCVFRPTSYTIHFFFYSILFFYFLLSIIHTHAMAYW